ncbi:MAG TPA: HD domain-containing protein [Candidatus Baltobacteraceae bacterium]|nr:HD domain-containing protein [Candidatus Baltobacteraceae bacterium]
MGKVFIQDLIEGEPITSFFLAKNIQVRQRRTGEPYLSLTLADRTGEVAAVMWEGITDELRALCEGDLLKVQVTLGAYQGQRQLTVARARKAMTEEIQPEDFLPCSDKDPALLMAALEETVAAMANPHLKQLLQTMLGDPEIRNRLMRAPAAKALHHAVIGGLLEHTASVVGLCRIIAEYYPVIDRDLLLGAAILHDLGKVRELTWERVFDYTDVGRLLGHITLGIELIQEHLRTLPDFPERLAMELLHCVLSHHGEYEWGSPKRPKTLEALVLHHAENLDGKINGFLTFTTKFADPQHPGWTQYNKSLERYLYFGVDGPEAPDPGPPVSA